MGTLRFEVTSELVARALHLPEDVRVVGMDVEDCFPMDDKLVLWVEHESFPPGLHNVTPLVHREPVKYTWDWRDIREPDRD